MIEVVLVTEEQAVADALNEHLTRVLGGHGSVVEKRNLDGASASWILVGGLALNGVRALLRFALEYLKLRQVSSIKVGDIEIRNPRPSDVDLILARVADQGAGDGSE